MMAGSGNKHTVSGKGNISIGVIDGALAGNKVGVVAGYSALVHDFVVRNGERVVVGCREKCNPTLGI